MSRYFQVLKRLSEAESEPGVAQPVRKTDAISPQSPRLAPSDKSREAEPEKVRETARETVPQSAPSIQPADIPQAAPPVSVPPIRTARVVPDRFAPVLERLRESAAGLAGTTVVVAAASSSPQTALRVALGIAKEAEHSGLRTLCVQAASRNGGLALEYGTQRESRRPRALNGSASNLQRTLSWGLAGSHDDEVEHWLSEAHRFCEVLVVSAPALASVPDAARLARVCSGLVLVAEARSTSRDDLESAAQQARVWGCNVLGIVFAEPRDWLSTWLHKF